MSILFAASALFSLVGLNVVGDKFAVWSFFFALILIIQLVIENNSDNKERIGLQEYKTKLQFELKNMAVFIYLMILGEINIYAERIKIKANSFDTEENLDVVSLVIYRWQEPMVKTYLYTSRVVSHITILIVNTIRLLISYGPFALFTWLIFYNVRQLHGYIVFFKDFFESDQTDYFWNQVGFKFLILGLIFFFLFWFIWRVKENNLRKKAIYGVVVLYFYSVFIQIIFNYSTPYRDNVKIWGIRPNSSLEAWVDVSISGRNFGETPFHGKVLIDGIEQRIISWNNKNVVFRTDPTITKSGFLTLKNYHNKVSNSEKFIYHGNK